MEKDYIEEDSMNSTGISADDDFEVIVDPKQYEDQLPRKRQKLVDQFDALCLEDDPDSAWYVHIFHSNVLAHSRWAIFTSTIELFELSSFK